MKRVCTSFPIIGPLKTTEARAIRRRARLAEWPSTQKRREYLRDFHQRHPGYKHNDASRRRKRNRATLDEIKRDLGCVDCGENNAACLDFDHRDRSQKLFTIGKRSHVSLSRLIDELIKCDVRCSNCHRKRHRADGVVGLCAA